MTLTNTSELKIKNNNIENQIIVTGDIVKTYSAAWPNSNFWGSASFLKGSWGDEMADAHMEMLRNETPSQRTTRLQAEAAADVKSHNGLVKYSVKRKEEKWCKGGEMKFRVPKPCKYASLFAQRICAGPTCGKKVPEGQTKCSCGEALAGCWNHAEKHSCIYVHPDEPQWEDACYGALCFDRQQQMFHLRTEPLAAINRFVAVARSAKEEPNERRSAQHSRSGKVYQSTKFAEKPVVKTEAETAW